MVKQMSSYTHMVDEGPQQWWLETEERAEAAKKSAATVDLLDFSDILNFDDIGDNDKVEETTKGKGKILHETGESLNNNVVQVVEEEIVKLEFEKVKPKLATHSMHCPNQQEPVGQVEPVTEQKDPVGCFSCLSLFTCSDNGCLNLFDIFRNRPVRVQLLSLDLPHSSNTIINEDEPETIPVGARSRGRTWLGYEGILAEILNSIVYGGLMEVIAILSVVVSASASGVTTLSIVALALASLIGGVFIIGHSLWELRDDCYKGISPHKYKELLGQVTYFPLHAFVAILSYLVFGMVPLVAYRYLYHETKDKDVTLVVVAAISLLCVSLLAILKAYINKCNVLGYLKTVIYYIILALFVSGVSYVVGKLVSRLLEKLGWFDTSYGGSMPCLPRVISPYLETF